MKKVALIYSGSNFEKQKESVLDLHSVLSERGDAIFLFTCYDASDNTDSPDSNEAIYSLASFGKYDGFVIDDSLNRELIERYMFETGTLAGKPVVMLNAESELAPSAQLDNAELITELLEHLILVHGCKKINFVADFEWLGKRFFRYSAIQAYKDALAKHNIPYEENRLVNCKAGIEYGRKLWDVFKDKSVADADAVICHQDICAMGLIDRLAGEGILVPERMKVVSMHRTLDSKMYTPDISGAIIENGVEANAVADLLYEQIYGKMLRPLKLFKAYGEYGASCGCRCDSSPGDMIKIRESLMRKLATDGQLKSLLQFNDSLEKVTSLEEYSELVKSIFGGLGVKNYAVCLNRSEIAYILDAEGEREKRLLPFEDMLYVLAGNMNGVDVSGREVSAEDVLPVEPKPGDLVIAMPIVHKNMVFGYVVMLNETMPILLYNYRVFFDSLGSSIEGLRQQMVLRHSINKLNELRTRDPLTGLYNREYIRNFKESIVNLDEYTVVMMDMDGLKKINDVHGHEEGNRAIKILANAINRASTGGDIIARYGGDEFVVMSSRDTSAHWEAQKEILNAAIKEEVEKEKLPYTMGVSIGYAVHNSEHPYSVSECFEIADENMYKNKVARKACRTD